MANSTITKRGKSAPNVINAERNTIQAIDERIVNSTDASEIVLLTSVRKEIIKQNEGMKKAAHTQKLETIKIGFNYSFSFVAFITGIAILFYGSPLLIPLAPLLVGAGLYAIAPKVVMKYFSETKGERDE